MTNFIQKYFTTYQEYPDDVAINPIPWGEDWSYISSTFLDGFINYASKIKSAFVLARYHRWHDDLNHEIQIMDPPKSFNWVKFKGTKLEIYKKLIKKGVNFHVKLDCDFQDDVLILSKLDEGKWIYFWYDRDCSDSCIGRFETSEIDETVIQDFNSWVMAMDHLCDENERARQIPLHYFQGWISSK